jgi:microcystin-dependent protein
MTAPSFTTGQILTAAQQNAIVSYTVPTGAVVPYAGATAPPNYLMCTGQAVSRTTYLDLFALISTTYGVGDGTTTFNVPNFKGRVPVGLDSTTVFTPLAATGGATTVTLTTANLASHTHVQDSHVHAQSDAGVGTTIGTTASNGFVTGSATVNAQGGLRGMTTVTATNQTAGGGTAHDNLQPYLVLNYIIKT